MPTGFFSRMGREHLRAAVTVHRVILTLAGKYPVGTLRIYPPYMIFIINYPNTCRVGKAQRAHRVLSNKSQGYPVNGYE